MLADDLGDEMITWNETRTICADENGNMASLERWGSEENAVAALESNELCTQCADCIDCLACHRCYRCTRCTGCTECTHCAHRGGLVFAMHKQGVRGGSVPDGSPDPINRPAHYTQHPWVDLLEDLPHSPHRNEYQGLHVIADEIGVTLRTTIDKDQLCQALRLAGYKQGRGRLRGRWRLPTTVRRIKRTPDTE